MSNQKFFGFLVGWCVMPPLLGYFAYTIFREDKKSLSTRMGMLWSILLLYILFIELIDPTIEQLISYTRLVFFLMLANIIMLANRNSKLNKEVKHLSEFIKLDGKEEQYNNYRKYVKKKDAEDAASGYNNRIV